MPQTPKEKTKPDNKIDNDTWESDQERRGYYYDDAHGYQTFDPDAEDEDDRDEEK